METELEWIKRRLQQVEKEGHGKVIITVTNGKMVYIAIEIGEQIKS